MARHRSVEPDEDDHPEVIDDLRDLCRREGLLHGDDSLLRMVNGLLGSKVVRLEGVLPGQVREVVARVKATRSLYGPLQNKKGQEWFLKRRKQEVEDGRADC